MSRLLRTDGMEIEVHPKNGKFTLEELYDLIGNGCDLIEVVMTDSHGVTMVVDEEGMLKNKAFINGRAMKWVNDNSNADTIIVGNVVLIDSDEMFD